MARPEKAERFFHHMGKQIFTLEVSIYVGAVHVH